MTITLGTDTYCSMVDADAYHEKFGNSTWTTYRKEISSIVTHVDGILITTKTAHGLVAGDPSILDGTTNYDGDVTAVTVVSTTQITVDAAWIADETSGVVMLESDYTSREIALRSATQWIDVTHKDRMAGSVTDDTQSLQYPRDGIYDDKGEEIADTDIPVAIQDATCEIALLSVDSTELYHTTSSSDSSQITEEKIGPITTKYFINDARVGQQPMFFKIESMMSALMVQGYSGNCRLVRS